MSDLRAHRLHLFLVFVFALVTSVPAAAEVDPVTTFIIEADSIARTSGDEALGNYVSEHSILVGAAIGQLLDVGFEVGQGGDTAAEEENVAFAERVARLLEQTGGSNIPAELVRIYKSWTPGQRAKRAEIKTLEAEAFDARNAGEFDKAAEMFRRVIDLCKEIDDRRTIAVTWGSLGVVHWYRGDMDAVEESYKKALEARRAIEDRILEGKTLNGLGSVSFQRGEYEKAIERYDAAAELRRRTGDLGGLGISLTYKGNSYYQLNRLVEARESFEEAYAILETAGSPAQRIEILNSIASIYSEMGNVERSNEAYLRAIDIAGTVDRPQDEAACRMNLADNYRLQDRFNDALAQLDAAKPLLERQPEPTKTAIFYKVRGLTYVGMGELDRAREDLVAYVEHSKELEDPFYSIDALIDLGYLYLQLGAFEQGRRVVEQVRPLAEGAGNTRLMRNVYTLASAVEQRYRNYEEALTQMNLALDIDRQEQAATSAVEDEIRIASFYAELGQNDKARNMLYGTLETISQQGLKGLDIDVHLGIADSFEKENPDSAVFHYERALSLVEASRAAVGGTEVRTGFFSGDRRMYYEEVARFYGSMGRKTGDVDWYDRAFVTMERAKARGLLDLLDRPGLLASTPAEEAMLDSLYSMQTDTPDQKEEHRQLEEQYAEARNHRLEASAGKLELGGGAVSDLAVIRKALPKKTALLEYALGDTVSLLWVVDRKGFDFYELPNRRTLAPQIQRLRDAIGQPGAGDAMLRTAARDLYASLVAPAEERIGKSKSLIIVPDGVLFSLPFEVLLTGDPVADGAWSEQPFLVRSYDTSYSPSASVFVKLRQLKKRKYDLELVAIGDPDFAADSSSARLEPLPYTRTEIEDITAYADVEKNRIYLGARATETALKRELNQTMPRFVHLATHGLVDPSDPIGSSVAFTPGSASGDDGFLHTLEILSMPFDVGLVVLSACESGSGRIQRGEGVVGLSRAFLAAGAGGVVASLWAVSDVSTAALMNVFYARMLGKKRPAAEALNDARLAMIENPEYSHPFYWSPFIVIGAGGSTPW